MPLCLPGRRTHPVAATLRAWACWLVALGCTPAVTPKPGVGGLCASPADCSDGLYCVLGRCADDRYVFDAGGSPDAGSSWDAGVDLDGGASDPDAAEGDASALDAGHADVDAADPGMPDAGPPDASDAGSEHDGGPPEGMDGGLGDAGALDGGADAGEDTGSARRCVRARDCAEGEVCNLAVGRCELQTCSYNEQCPTNYKCSAFLSRCVYQGCLNDSQCDLSVGERCDIESGACLVVSSSVGCRRDGDCADGERCETVSGGGLCVVGRRCAIDANCPAGERCTPDGVCEVRDACSNDGQCDADQRCLLEDGERSCLEAFVYCDDDADCCAYGDCRAQGVACDVLSRRCVAWLPLGCRSSADCGPSQACHPELFTCIYPTEPCTLDPHCPPGEVCDADLKRCVPRVPCSISGCPEGRICLPGTEECLPVYPEGTCQSSLDCEPGTLCELSDSVDGGPTSGTCKPIAGAGRCENAVDCRFGELCDRDTGVCLQAPPLVSCGAAGGVCEANEECADRPDGSDRVCVPVERGGLCDRETPCSNVLETCDLRTGLCVRPPPQPRCETNAACAAGQLCDLETGFCLPLAGTALCQSQADCRASELCDALTGRCVSSPPCELDVDCAFGRGCDLESGVCVALGQNCLLAADCASSEVCTIIPGQATGQCKLPGGPCSGDADCVLTEYCDLSSATCQLL